MPLQTLLLGFMALVAGCCLSVQSAVNTQLTRGLGSPLLTAVLSFSVGLTALIVASVASRQPLPSAEMVKGIAPYAFVTGGLVGAFYIFCNSFLTPRLGVAVFMATVIAGQLLAAVVLDHYGLLGMMQREASPGRIVGVFVMFAGVLMIRFL